MKFKIVLILICSLLANTIEAQDILIKKNGEEINCKVLELSNENISFSILSATDSLPPETLLVKKAEVFMIRYSNGTKDVFNTSSETENKVVVSAQEKKVVSEQIEVEGRKFYYQNRKLGKSRLIGILRNEKDKQINALVTKSVICAVFAPMLKFLSIPAGIVGFVVLGVEANDYNNGSNDIQNRNIAVGCLTGFVLGQAGGYTVEHFQYKNLKEAVKLYNAKH